MRTPRWAWKAFALLAAFLIPWSLYIGFSLPTHSLARHYNLAWAGFDGLLLVAAGVTAFLAARRSPLVHLPAMATGTLLVVDAWFDVVTAGSHGAFVLALVLALAGEVPLAVVSWWLAARASKWPRVRAGKRAEHPHERAPKAALANLRTGGLGRPI